MCSNSLRLSLENFSQNETIQRQFLVRLALIRVDDCMNFADSKNKILLE